MRILTLLRSFLIFSFLLITNSVSSKNLNVNISNPTEIINFNTFSVSGISPTSGHAGTVVTITGLGFTPTSTVVLGSVTIPVANIQFVSATELKVTLPCGLNSGFFTVDGIASTVLFNYIDPTVTTILPNLSYCVGTTVSQIVLSGTPTVPTTPTTLEFSWTNTNTAIGLVGNGVGNLPTFTAVNATLEPITSTVVVTPSINGCAGTPKSYTITVNPRPVVTPISNISVCAGTPINQIILTASSPNSGTGTSFSWGGTNNAAIGLSTNSGVTSPIPSFTAVNATNGLLSSVFTVTPTFQGCIGTATNFTIQVTPSVSSAPTIGTITQPTCTTTSGSVILSGLPIGNWTITKLPGGQTFSNTGNTYTITNLAPGTYTFSVSNGTCSSSPSQNVVILSAPIQTEPIVGIILQPSCAIPTGSVTLSGLPAGNWSLTRSPDGVLFSGTGTSATISGLASGTYNYTVTNASGCVSLVSNAIVINVQPASPSAPIANAQSFLASANATVSNLQIVSSGSPIWYTNAVGGTAFPSATLLTTGIYYASQTVNGCESTSRTAVNVSVFPNSSGGSVSGTTTVCFGTNSTVLTLSGYIGSIIRWESSTVIDFSANVLPINVQSATYTATNLTAPLYFRAVVQSGIFPVDYSSPAFIDVVAQSIGGNLSASTSVCLGQNSGIVSVSGYVGTIVRWEQSVDNGSNWSSINNTSNTYTSGALLVSTKYRVVVQNGVCPSVFSTEVTITVKSTPVVTDFPNQQVCFGDTKTFGDPFVAGYTYSLTSDIGYSSILPQVSITFNQVVTQTYTYTVTNTVTGCSAQDQFQVIVNPLPSATVITNTSICEGNSIAIGANSIIGSTYSWTSIPSGFIDSTSNPSVTPAVSTTYLLEETTTATGCKKSNQTVITLQPIPVLTIVGSPQFNICETTTQVQLNATITNPYASFVWTKIIGSGSFDNSTILNPIYSPSVADVVLGSVTLRLSVIGLTPCIATYTQDVVIIIDKKPIANAGLDVITCGTNPIQINAVGTLNATNLVWTLTSGITGTLNLSNPYTPIFTPSANDLNYVGPIGISLTASSNTTCPSSTDMVSVLITPAPVVDAGPPTAIICQGSNYIVPFNPTASQNIINSTILWTKGTGDGTIVSGNSLTPTYIPGPIDIANGTVTLTLSASGNNPCNTPATDSIIITIVKNPIVNAGADTSVCQGSINVNATIQNAGTILWTVTNGNGNFVDPTAISPIYIPAPTDLNTTVTFTVAVTPINACGPTVSDSVLYTIKASPSVVAGSDATICQSNATYQLQATATNTTLITWTSTGSGSFDNIHNEDPIYTLSPNDINAGSVTFTITGAQTSCPDDTDIMVLTIQKNPIANAGPAQIICQGDSVVIPGTSNNSNAFSWVRNGGTGTFINANTTNPTYTSQLSESGTIYLTLIADAIAPCTVSANSNTTIDIIPRATADAGLDAQICEGATFQITTAGASNNVGVQWSTNGDGTFTGGSTISPIYTPGPSDNNNGSVTLTLVATKNFPCNANAVDQMTLIINKIPVITVINPDVDLCVGDPFYIVSGVVPTNYDTLAWSTSGSGTFAPNTTSVTPTYFPSASDYTLGTVTLTLTASRNPLNCNSSSSNTITLHFITKPTANAGPVAATICQGSFYVTNGATASNYSNVTWSSSGSGTFTNATTLLATYTPSALDYTLGFVNLTLTANTISPCTGVATDVIRLNLQRVPVITVRANDTICLTQNTYAIGGTSVTDYSANSEVWSSSGTGTFSPSGDSLNPIYNPSTDDLAAGFVTLTITVNSIAPCVIPVSNSFVLNFQKLPVANAGPTLVACDTPFHITTATATISTVSNLVWSTSGTGTFDYTNVLDPIYTPSAFDVLNSPITLTLTANAIAPCTTPSVTTVLLNIVNSPIITVANQLPICQDTTNVTVLGTTVQFQSSFVWTSTTGTTISNSTILNPIVTPSAQDIINNQIVLTITAQPVAPCGVPVSKTVTIPIQKKPIVSAGASQTICEGSIITTSDALSSNVTNLHWDNNGGDGIFTTSNLNTVTEYTPGPNEIASGQVLLTIIGDAISPCSGTVTATVAHAIIKNPIVTINPTEITICETQTSYTVPSTFVTLVNPSSILNYQWTTPNMASLTGASTWTPTYSPTAADIATGFVYLTLTVNPIAPCAIPIIKTLKINISKQATISFANDGFFCEGISKPLSASFTNYNPASISWTIVNGTGSITGANTATPTYIPASDSGTVVIRISVASVTPCTNSVTQDFTITVVKKPIVAMTTTTDTVCSSQLTYNLSGNTTQFASSILWTRVNPVGTGTFSNSTILNPVYTFNAADIANGFVTLRLTALSDANCGFTDFKEITINITKEPTVVTTPTDTICQGAVFTASATATNNSSVLWSTVGTSNGLFSNANQLVTQYTPGSNDINSFTIQVTALGNAPCASVSVTKVVTIQQQPTLDAGLESRANCSNQPYQITGVTGQNLGTILWTSNSGAPGTFSNPTSLNPTYAPSATELSSGLPIVLTVTAQAVAPCSVSVSDFIILNLSPNQVVAAGTYPSICEGASVSLIGNATNSISVYWTSSGTGTFSAINSLNTNYIPSNSDVINGTVTLTLHAISDSNCPEVNDSTVVTILRKPIANAGTNASICQGSSYTLSAGEASAQNFTALTWTATGPGALNLSTINSLTPTYVPAVGQTGIVTLTLTATGYSACGIDAVSTKTITIVPQPFATIPSSKTICEGETLVITNTDASAINYSTLQWTSSNGLGSFSPNNTAATIYSPATGQTGTVTLSLTATALGGVCPSVVGTLLLDIIAKPIVEAGTNGTICQSATYTVTGASVQNQLIYSWSVSGPATIQTGTETTLNPVIVPNLGATGTVTVTLTAVGTGICPVVITDFLTIQINPIPVVNAGTDGTLCEGILSFQLNGTVLNANSYTWTTTGGGIIQQTANPLAPLYVPSASDYATSTGVKVVTINLNATTTNGCSAVADTMQLTLYAKPKVNAGIDLLACQDSSSVLLNGATVSNYNSSYTVSWSSSGNGTWDYTNSNGGINPVYIFGSNDTSSVTLTISALPNSICPQVAVTDTMVVTIRQNPTIVATSNEITMCGETFTMPDLVTVNNGNSILWTNTTGVSGTPGVLTNATTETPIFTPSANEIANGFALLTLTALPQSGCSVAAVNVIKVNLRPKAIVNAGTNVTACQGEIITINNGALVQNYTSYSWSENGTGTIDPATINTLNPKYYPGANETGVITFTLQATNLLPCAGLVTQTMTVTISSQPTVNAGPDATICQNTNYTLGTATVANNATVLWSSSQNSNGTSSGTYVGGIFSSTTIINPTYTPSQDDVNLGYVFLTVRANSTLCSSLVSDVIKITISKNATLVAGSDATICEGTSFALAEASQSNATTLVWTSSQNSNGTSSATYISGSFSSTSILNPIYTPSTDDINLGRVYLTLTGSGNSNCPNASSQMVLNIVKKPTVSTTDVQMCMNSPQISLNGVASNYQSFNWSIYSGPGSISPNLVNPLNPTFISGISGLSTVQTTVVRLFVTPNAGCPQATAVYDDLVITIQPLPTVEAGVSGSVCYISGQPIAPFAISGSSVTNASSQNWTSSGVGIFTVGTPVLYQSLSNSCTTEILTLTANGIGACSTSTASDSVTLTVNCSIPSLGTITSNSSTTICQGATATYSIPANTNVQNYTWSVPNGASIQSGQNTNTIQVLYSLTASSGNVAVTGTNGCGSIIATLPIVIDILPTGSSVVGPQSVCAGANNIVYTATAIPNATSYIWTLPNGSTITTATNLITISFGLNEVSGNLSVSGSNSCGLGSVSSAFPITINPRPSLLSSLSPPAICSNTQFNYVPTSATAGATFGWTRALQSGISNLAASGSTTINEILINTTPNAVSVSYQITTTSTQGCTNTQTVVVIVNPAPSLTSTTSPAAICSGSVFNYTPLSGSPGTITWVRNPVVGIVELASNGSGMINEVLTNSTSLPITVTYLLSIPATANGCSGATTTLLAVTINPSPQVTVNSINLCFGTSQLITATPNVSGTYSYVWTVPTGVLNPGNTGSFSLNTAGTYSVVITNTTTLCSSTSASGTVTIVPLPIVTLNSASICVGTTTTLTATPSAVGTYTYLWTVPTGVINPGNATSITSGIAGIYSVSITDTTTNCSSSVAFGTITVNPLPIVSVNSPSICAGANAIVTATPSTVGTYNYSWTVPTGALNPGNSASFSTTVAGLYSVIITNPTTNCSSISASGTVTVNPIPTVSVNSASICAGSSVTITATPTLSGVYSYSWMVPTGVTAPGNVSSFSASVTGTYSVLITNTITNCTSASASGILTVNPIPSVTVNSATICAGYTTTITATTPSIGPHTYVWTVPTGAINPGNFNSLVTGIAGNYSVVITNTTSNCSSSIASGTITVNSLPIVSVNSASICSGSNALLTANPSTIGTYSYAWTVPTGATNPGNTASFSTTVAGTYSVVITNTTTNCSSLSASGTVAVSPIPMVTVNNASVCAGSSTTITATPSLAGTYSYVWTVPAGSNNPGNSASFTASVAGTYSVIITNTSTNCVSVSASGILTVNPIPIVTLNSASICQAGTSVVLTSTPTFPGNYSYVWTVPTGATNPGNASSIITGIAGTYSVVITDAITNCSSISASGTIIVNQLPLVSVSSTSVCAGTNALVTATPAVVGSYTYAWTVPVGVTNPGNVASFSTPIAGTYSVVITNTVTTCFSAIVSGTVTVNALPIAFVNSETICAGSSAILTATPNLPGTYSYAWIVPNGASNPGNTSSFSTSIAGTYSVVITNTTTNCSSALASGILTAISLPIVNITNPSPVCAPNTVDITATTTGSSSGLTFSYWNNSSATIAVANPTSISISGTYYIKGTNAFGCSTIQPVVVVINPNPAATISGQNSFIVCQNGTQPIITFTGSNGTAPYTFSYQINAGPIQTITSLASSNTSSVAIPTTIAGNYTITLLNVQDASPALCGSSTITLPNSAFVEVQQVGTIVPTNQVIVSQTVCQGTPIIPIVFTIGGASTNAYVTNLPAGLNGVYNISTRTLTISGTPLTPGIFNYVVNTSGSTNGCNATYGGTITVNSNDSITALTPATVNQTLCATIPLQSIVYGLGGGATGGIVTFAPNTPVGISWSIVSNTVTISGASNTIGTFTYTVQSFGLCGQSTATGTITINSSATVALVSGNPSPTVCSGTSFATPIQYSILPASATMLLSGALPIGVTFNAVTGLLSGTPTQSGLFPYTISSSTGCGNLLSGVINVSPVQSISYVSGNTNQVACQYTSIDPINFIVSSGVNTLTITPAFPAGISYSLINGIVTISGTPTSATSLAQNYTITTQGTCGPQATYSVTFDIRPEATITLITGSGPINQAVCQSSAIIPIRFTVGGGATGIVIPALPAGLTLTLDPLTGIYTIQGNPLVNGIFNFPITTTGCPKTLFITISNVNSSVGITLTSAVGTDNQTLCQSNFNSPISPITYTIIGATNVVVNGLPIGVTAVFSPTTGQLIISGTSTQAGIFNYTITSLPCSVVKAGVIRVSTPMFITNEVVTNISCSGSNDGAIAVTIIGGVAFNGLYAVHWSGPNGFQQNQTTITGLQAGQYVLTGTDVIGCPIPTMTYTVLPAQPINISLQSSTNVNCNGVLGCANLNITGGSGIYTLFTLQYLDPSSQTLTPITPANNNYFNICNLRAGLYYLTVKDSRNCTTAPYLFTIYDYSSLSIESITMDATLCQNTPGKIRIKVNSLDTDLSFYYNSVLVPAISLGNSIYEVSIDNPTVPTGIIKVKNGQDCWVTTTVSTAIVSPDFEFTSNDFRNYGYYSVNGSVQFTNLVNMASIPAEYAYIVWDFGDNTSFKVFYNPEDLLPNADGDSFETVFHTYTTNGIYQVTLTVYNHFGCSRKVTKTIIIGSGATMMLPTIFTPNGDGINDMFRPSLIGLKDVTMYIYDNWGNVVYEVSSDVSLLSVDWGWNGIEKGQTEPINNDYRYYIIATTINDKKIEKEGRFLLVK
jgi:gliding motility-associated-like protein